MADTVAKPAATFKPTATINKLTNTVTADVVLSITNYFLVLLSFIIFVVLELVNVDFDIKVLNTWAFWSNVFLNTMLTIMVLTPMLNEGTRAGMKELSYTIPANALAQLLSTIRAKGHTTEFSEYIRCYNANVLNLFLEEEMNKIGLTLKKSMNEFLTLEEYTKQNQDKLSAIELAYIEKLKNAKRPRPISVADFYTVIPQNYAAYTITINRFKEQIKVVLPKIVTVFASYVLIKGLILESVSNPTFTVVVLLSLKVFTILLNVIYGFLGGKQITSEKLPVLLNNRINIIKSFAIEYKYFKEYDIQQTEGTNANNR